MTITVSDLRFSVIWFEGSLGLLAVPQPSVPGSYRGRIKSYAHAFNDAIRFDPTGQLKAPWPSTGKHRFWWYYIGREVSVEKIDGFTAWKAFIPLRTRFPHKLAGDVQGKFTVESFLYPHGHAVVANVEVRSKEPASLEDIVYSAMRLRQEQVFKLAIGDGKSRSVHLDDIGEELLNWLRTETFGNGAPRGRIDARPYTVATFVQTEGASGMQEIEPQSPVHRAVQATTSWSSTWFADALRPINESKARIDQPAPLGHLMYVEKRGRTVWFPEKSNKRIAKKGEDFHLPLRALGCYHRNQVFAALQVESLGSMMSITHEAVERGEHLSQDQEDYARRAADLLGRLYSGQQSTYRSGSVREHIERAGMVEPTNSVRARNGKPALFA